jgi:tripartite-type tricarboxylate transporter receptor subunit TctC
MMMPYAAGGPGDTITRLFAGSMQKILGQQIVVDNTAGASGSIGTAKVARSKPFEDGQIGLAKNAAQISKQLKKK